MPLIITRIYVYYTFEQVKFEKDMVIKNQASRQNVKVSVEKDFYKLMNNANFGYDCRNNADNCTFVSVFDEIEGLSYTKRFQSIFAFVSSELLEKQIKEDFLNKICAIEQIDEYFEARKNSVE